MEGCCPWRYDSDKYSVCCLAFGYRLERDEAGDCYGYEDVLTDEDDDNALVLTDATVVEDVECDAIKTFGYTAGGGDARSTAPVAS